MNVELIAGQSLYPEIVADEIRVKATLNLAAMTLGVPAPRLTVRRDSALGPREFQITMAGTASAARSEQGVPAGALLVRSSPLFVEAQIKAGDPAFASDVQPWPDPVQPGHASSIVYDLQPNLAPDALRELMLTAVEATALVLARWFRRAAADNFDHISAAQVLAQLPAYAAVALLRTCSIDIVTGLLRRLLRDSIPLGEFASIAPLLADESRVEWTETGSVVAALPGHLLIAAPRPQGDAERRRVIARAVAMPHFLRRRTGNEALQVWVLDEVRGWMMPEQARPEDVAHFDRELIRRAAPAASVDGAILLTSPARRANIAERLGPGYPDLMVVASHELPRGVALRQRGRVTIAPPI